MKIIAINDAPRPIRKFIRNGVELDIAYLTGDIFEIHESYIHEHYSIETLYTHIISDKLGIVSVLKENFISLDEYRQLKINEIIK